MSHADYLAGKTRTCDEHEEGCYLLGPPTKEREQADDVEVVRAVQAVRLRAALHDALDQPMEMSTTMLVETVLDTLAERIPIALHKIEWASPSTGHQFDIDDCPDCELYRELFRG